VRIVDLGLFGTQHLPPEVETIIADIRNVREEWLSDVDAVINLAGLSNDPMADFSPRLNYEFNAAAAALLAQAVKRAGIRRFIFASSCSVYGFSEAQEVDEEWPAKPQFPYAVSKLMAEKALWCLQDESFCPIILRKGTVIGWSPRMRYDLVANAMVRTALTHGRIIIHNPRLWRPLIDVEDAARAYVQALEAPADAWGTFNIACRNFSVGEIAQEVAATLADHGVWVTVEEQQRQDPRSYRVSLQRARYGLGFEARRSIRDAVTAVFQRIRLGQNDDLDNPRYINVEWLKANYSGSLAVGQQDSIRIWSAVATPSAP
jgi:nucleoside-diphosphate-sugar epimerase